MAIGSDPVCATYRFGIPLRGMIARSWCSAMLYSGFGRVEIARGNPVLTQRQIAFNAQMVEAVHANGATLVHDIDDLLWDIPSDNPNVAAHTPPLIEAIDTSMRLADVVTASTEPLAAALEARGIGAVIVPNLIDPVDWQVRPKRTPRTRLRVGWYGQRNVHIEDLRVLEAVVTALRDRVDFVFYGDIPHGLAAHRADLEIYPPTALELFPTMLATLDLDILLSPLANNAFNECKSNLRLLQAGMLAYAVIATDIEPHRTLPVTLVANSPAAWIAAIRDRIGELDAVHAEGRTLQAAVHARYILDDARAEQIFTTWTGRAPVSAQ